MYETITASIIRRKYGLTPRTGKRCFICINNKDRIEMVCRKVKGAANGNVWSFVCPITGIHCRKLHLVNGRYIHRSIIKGYYRKIAPAWQTRTLMDKLLKKVKGKIDAEKEMERKFFKSHYRGKPTKKYLKCLKQIEDAGGITMSGIINGKYDSLLKHKIYK
jgi:hypothetical protein